MDIQYVRHLTTAEEQLEFAKALAQTHATSFDTDAFTPLSKEELEKLPYYMFGYGNPVSCGMVCRDLDVYFDGSLLTAAGVTETALIPEAAQSQGLAHVFEAVMPEWYEGAISFSLVHPAFPELARRLGYTPVSKFLRYHLPTAALGCFELRKPVQLVYNADLLKPIRQAYVQHLNLAVRRQDDQWDISRDPFKDGHYTYLVGQNAYVSFEKKAARPGESYLPGSMGCVLHVTDLAFKAPADFRDLLAFLYTLRAQYQEIELSLPLSVPLLEMLPNHTGVRTELQIDGMARVISVSKALRQMSYPKLNGSFVIHVTDPIIEANNAVYQVNYSNRRATVLGLGSPEEYLAAQKDRREREAARLRGEDVQTALFPESETFEENVLETAAQAGDSDFSAGFLAPDPSKDITVSSSGDFFDRAVVKNPAGSITFASIPTYRPKDAEINVDEFAAAMAEGTDVAADADAASSSAGSSSDPKAGKFAGPDEPDENASLDEKLAFYGVQLSCPIDVFTQLVTGALTPDEILFLPGVICTRPDNFRRVFTKRNVCFAE